MEATQVIDDNEIIDAVQDIVENEEETEEDKCPSVSHKIASKFTELFTAIE